MCYKFLAPWSLRVVIYFSFKTLVKYNIFLQNKFFYCHDVQQKYPWLSQKTTIFEAKIGGCVHFLKVKFATYLLASLAGRDSSEI